MVKYILSICFILGVLKLNAQNYTVNQIQLKVDGDVYAPVLYQQKLVVCSNIKSSVSKTVLDEKNEFPVNLYVLEPSSPAGLTPFSKYFQTDFHDGPIAFNDSLNRCVISQNLIPPKGLKSLQKEKNFLGLFFSEKTGEEWSAIVPFAFNSFDYTISHPALSADGKTLVFTSDMPGGYGGFDLWVSYFDNTWSKPENLGPKINSSNNEVFPTLQGDQLFFSSNRNGGIGGLDIYSIYLNQNDNALFRMPEPINSKSDDFGMIFSKHSEEGYLSSNRDGKDRIYSFKLNFPEFVNCNEQVYEDFCYTLFEENAAELTVVSLVYQWTIGDLKFYGIEIDYCFPGPGDYVVSLDIMDTILKETYFNQASYDMSLRYTEQAYITSPDTIKPMETIQFTGLNSYLPGLTNRQYYWEFPDGSKKIGESQSFLFKEEGVFQVKLGVTGILEGDSVSYCSYKTMVCNSNFSSNDPHNIFTGTLPLDSTNIRILKDSLTKIYSILLGMGDSIAIVNHPLYRHLSAFDLRMEYIPETGKYDYVIGRWKDINDAHESWKTLIDLGFNDALVKLFLKRDSVFFPLKKFFVVNDLNFDHNSWKIRPDAEKDLIRLVKILNDNPELILEIAAHTDSEGPDDFNLKLSHNRAISVQNYLIANKIDPARLNAKGYGEKKPIGDNKTEEGKAKNRRVEFKLTIKKL